MDMPQETAPRQDQPAVEIDRQPETLRILIIHPNFPGQFGRLFEAWSKNPHGDVRALHAEGLQAIDDKVEKQNIIFPENASIWQYPNPPVNLAEAVPPQLLPTVVNLHHGNSTRLAMIEFSDEGWIPDVIITHPSWGSHLYCKQVFPDAILINYCEYIELPWGPGCHSLHDKEFPRVHADDERTIQEHAWRLQAMELCDAGVAPTEWQKSLYPAAYRDKISVIHEGLMFPDDIAPYNYDVIPKNAKVVTFAARALEPSRGWHTFLRALKIVQAHDVAGIVHAVVIGDLETAYDSAPPGFKNWTEAFLATPEIKGLDLSRVHFTGAVPHFAFLKHLRGSDLHIHFNPPSVLSWSVLEVMGMGVEVLAADNPQIREAFPLINFSTKSALRATMEGMLWAPHNHEELAQKMMTALSTSDDSEDRKLRQECVKIIQEHVRRKYSAKAGIKAWNQFIWGLLSNKRGGLVLPPDHQQFL
jgi:glycosyltransferase involved in cell wall biosynthesis